MPISAADKKWIAELIADELSAHKTEIIKQISLLNDTTSITDAVKAAIAPLQKQLADLNETVSKKTAEISSLTTKLTEKDTQINKLEADVIAATKRNIQLHSVILEKADDSESYSRKDSLCISGIEFKPREDNAALQTRVIQTLKSNGVNINDNDIFRLHHCSKPVPMNKFKKFLNNVNETPLTIDENDPTKTAEIIVRFSNWRARSNVHALRYGKDLPIRVNVDLTSYRRDLLVQIRDHLKANDLKAYAYVNSECRIVLKDVDANDRAFIQNWDHFEQLAQSLAIDPRFHRRPFRS